MYIFVHKWATQVILYDNESTLNALKATIGHELTHKGGDFFSIPLGLKAYRFIAQTNEVHADFGAAQKMLNGGRTALLQAIKYKQDLVTGKDGDCTHPSWQRRYHYAANYNFNEELVCKIAEDVGCKNRKLIRQIISHYEEIDLN